MDLFEDLLKSLENHLGEGNDATSPSSIQAALAAAPPVNLPPDASVSLLQECFANVWTEPERDSTHGNISASPLPSSTTGTPSVGADPVLPSTPPATSSSKQKSSHLSRAIKNRMQRGKGGSEASHSAEVAATEENDSTGASLDNLSTDHKDADDNAIAIACFQSFLAEMKDFQKNSRQLQTKKDILNYANYLEQKYVVLGLDKLSVDCATATKSRPTIESFVEKLRARVHGTTPAAEPAGPWACTVCTFPNANGDCECQTCGRRRGTTPKKKTPKPVFVPLVSSSVRAKKSNKTPLDRQKDLFLKQKDDYEQDAREDIADEVTQLLWAVRGSTDDK